MDDSWKITGKEMARKHQREHEILEKEYESKIAMAKLDQAAEIRKEYAEKRQELDKKHDRDREAINMDDRSLIEHDKKLASLAREKSLTLDDPDKPDPPKGGPQNKSKDKELGKEPDSKSPQGLEKNQIENTPKDLSEAQRRAEAERWIKQQELKRQRERERGRDSR